MPKVFNRALQVAGESRRVGASQTLVTVLEYDKNGLIYRAQGATVPTDGDAGYAVGCIFMDTDGGVNVTSYVNDGSITSCDFNAAIGGTGDITSVVAGAGLTGGGASGAVTLNVINTDGKITVGADTIDITAGGLVNDDINAAAGITAGKLALATGSVMLGAAGVGSALDAKGDGKIIVGNSTTATSVAVSGDITLSNAGVVAIGAGKVTPAMSSQAEAVTATADGLTTGLIAVTARHVTVTCDSAEKIVTLPASVVGKEITIRNGATGYELRTTAASSIKMNDIVGGSTNEMAVPATALLRCTCVSATEWVVTCIDKLGAVVTALIPDAV